MEMLGWLAAGVLLLAIAAIAWVAFTLVWDFVATR